MGTRKLLLVTLIFSLLGLIGCQHTVEGFGQDLQQNGQEIQKSASK